MIKIILSLCIYFGAIFIPAFVVYAIRKYIRRRRIRMLAAKYEPRILMPESAATVVCTMYTSRIRYAATNASYEAVRRQFEQYKERVIRNINEGDKETDYE